MHLKTAVLAAILAVSSAKLLSLPKSFYQSHTKASKMLEHYGNDLNEDMTKVHEHVKTHFTQSWPGEVNLYSENWADTILECMCNGSSEYTAQQYADYINTFADVDGMSFITKVHGGTGVPLWRLESCAAQDKSAVVRAITDKMTPLKETSISIRQTGWWPLASLAKIAIALASQNDVASLEALLQFLNDKFSKYYIIDQAVLQAVLQSVNNENILKAVARHVTTDQLELIDAFPVSLKVRGIMHDDSKTIDEHEKAFIQREDSTGLMSDTESNGYSFIFNEIAKADNEEEIPRYNLAFWQYSLNLFTVDTWKNALLAALKTNPATVGSKHIFANLLEFPFSVDPDFTLDDKPVSSTLETYIKDNESLRKYLGAKVAPNLLQKYVRDGSTPIVKLIRQVLATISGFAEAHDDVDAETFEITGSHTGDAEPDHEDDAHTKVETGDGHVASAAAQTGDVAPVDHAIGWSSGAKAGLFLTTFLVVVIAGIVGVVVYRMQMNVEKSEV